jgi:predicted transcriptional regulator
MATPPSIDILDTEWDLLAVLWQGPRTASQVAQTLARKRGWAYSTVKTLLDRMVAKGLATSRQVGNVWEYRARVSRSRARHWAWRRFVALAFGGAVEPSLAFVAQKIHLGRRERAALRRALDELEDDDE